MSKEELKSKNENLFKRNTVLLNENERLKKQVEAMKCCGNCDWSNYLPNGNCLDCDGKKNWKLKEIEK